MGVFLNTATTVIVADGETGKITAPFVVGMVLASRRLTASLEDDIWLSRGTGCSSHPPVGIPCFTKGEETRFRY
jgi:hypothetical protein